MEQIRRDEGLVGSSRSNLEESQRGRNQNLGAHDLTKERLGVVLEEVIEAFDNELREKRELVDSLVTQLEESRGRERDGQEKIEELSRTIASLKENLRDQEQLLDSLIQNQSNEQSRIDDLQSTLQEVLTVSSDPQYQQFPYEELQVATDDFQESRKIGEGGYGSVYKGLLRQTVVAIKKLHPSSQQGLAEFHQEVNILTMVRHPHVVNLIGACSTPEPCLVYEFLQNGSLEDRLECRDGTPPLSWRARIRIATEICSALVFLHSHRPNSVVHSDLNPRNILLDGHLVAKIGDFGICRTLHRSTASTMFHQTLPRGTLAFIDPAFMSSGTLTASSDVYSFGVVILRLLTGKPAPGLISVVENALASEKLSDILDSSAGEWPYASAEKLAHLGIRCCTPDRETRANLENDVWQVLVAMLRASSSEPPPAQLNQADDSQAPPYFVCPILQEVMTDPQVAADGFTYEAEGISGWLSTRNTSPMTNLELPHRELLPNRTLRSAIQEWVQQQRRPEHQTTTSTIL